MLDDLKFYLSLFIRRLHYFLIVAVAVSSVGFSIAYTLPPVYEARAQLLVESPQIPGNLAASTVQVSSAEILQIIRQRLLTRANMLEIARDLEIYRSQSGISPDKIVSDMRNRIAMSLPRRRDAAAFVSISFEADNGPLSAKVVNELVTRVLDQNVTIRKSVAGGTLGFFQREVERLDRELSDQGQLILEFKLENKDALPDSMDFRRAQQASLQERLLQLDRELVSLKDRRARLQEVYERNGEAFLQTEAEMTPDQRRLSELQDALASALAIYSEQNPRIKSLRRQIEVVEQKVARSNVVVNDSTQEPATLFEVQMIDLEGQMDFLAQQRTTLETQIQELEASIQATPVNAVTLGSLERDYENLRTQYNQATSDLAAARIGDQIEAQSRGQRITVIEQAVAPRQPTSPNRQGIAMAGIGGGIIAGIGLVVLLELLNSSIRRPADLRNRLGINPIVTIPYIRTRKQAFFRKAIIVSAIALVAVGIPAALFYIDQNIIPMDLLIDRVLDRTGLRDLLTNIGLIG